MDKMKKIIAIVGMSGSGKSEATSFFKNNFNFDIFYFGGIILKEIEKRGLEINNENEKKVREDLRSEFGNDILAKIASNAIDASKASIVLDGLYSFTEYKILKELFLENFIVIAIHSDKELRYKRLSQRRYRPLNKDEVDRRDYMEIENIEKGGPIVIADYHILNNGEIEVFKENLARLLDKIFKNYDNVE
ncbi:MAG: AAA family ATPase [Bacteroidales bacterium]|jgi:dephospho-CoA kinase|nr:AAA family ATPase [Bacteroidales bacterium]